MNLSLKIALTDGLVMGSYNNQVKEKPRSFVTEYILTNQYIYSNSTCLMSLFNHIQNELLINNFLFDNQSLKASSLLLLSFSMVDVADKIEARRTCVVYVQNCKRIHSLAYITN